jgi:hypothetical protein
MSPVPSTSRRHRAATFGLYAGSVLLLASVAAVAAIDTPDYHRDIRPLVEARCLGCHSDTGVAFSMEDVDTAYQLGPAMAQAVAARRMPPFLAEPGHQQYMEDSSLSADEVRLFAAWAEADYPKGTPGTAARGARAAAEAEFEADLSIDVLPDAGYLPVQTRKDDYRCFVLDWPMQQPAYITGFRALPGNARVAHHLVLFAVEPQLAARFRALDAAEEGAGYQCFGGAVPDRLGEPDARKAYEAEFPNGVRELNQGNFWLAHWAPGMGGYRFPAGTGLRLEPGTVLIAQMHYYAGFAPGESDRGSRMQFQVADAVDKPAFHFPLTDYRWLETDQNGSMVIEPGRRATFEASAKLGDLVKYVARVTKVPEAEVAGLEVHSANLHMHAFGSSGRISLTDGHGRRETLLSVPRWDLAWQRDFTFTAPKVFTREALPRTRLTVECTFENPGQTPVHGGYGSDEEMCFNFSYIAVQRGPAATPAPAGATAGTAAAAGTP